MEVSEVMVFNLLFTSTEVMEVMVVTEHIVLVFLV